MLPETAWCSPSNPQGSCSSIYASNGTEICKPMTYEALDLFRAVQRALNALLQRDGSPAIEEDGRPGYQTVNAANRYRTPAFRDCNQLCASAPELLALLEQKLSAPSTKLPKAAATPAIKKSGFPWIIAVLLGGLGVWLYYEDKKKPKKERWF